MGPSHISAGHRPHGAPMRPPHGSVGHRPHRTSMRPSNRPAGHRPHGPSMNPIRPNMNGMFHSRIDVKDYSFIPNSEIELLLFNSNYCISSVKKRKVNLPTSTRIFSAIPTGYWNDRSANLTLILVDRFYHYNEIDNCRGWNHDRGSDFSEESVKKSLGKESANESGSKFISCFDSSFVEFIQPYSKEFVNMFVRIGFGSTIKLVSFDVSQVVTFNGKFVCGFRNGDCGTESQSDNTVDSPHGFVIYGIEDLKGNEKVTKVIDVENWRIDNSRVLRWIVSLIE
nr:hypothetical protein [Tanacetum cinerariifolium]